MHNQDYIATMQAMGLSTHDRQLERRKAKYPAHFKQKRDGKWYITTSLKYFLEDCVELRHACAKLKGGNDGE